jgi:hypothetical protein
MRKSPVPLHQPNGMITQIRQARQCDDRADVATVKANITASNLIIIFL